MHESVMAFGERALVLESVTGARVLEVGAANVNGSLRAHVEALDPQVYIGVDFMDGIGVDFVLDAANLVEHFGAESFDVVISTEMLEHAEDWRSAIDAIKRVLVPDGLVLLTARGPGMFLHGYPHDWWRFTTSDMLKIFADFQIIELLSDPQAPGVLLFARKPDGVTEYVDLSQIDVAPADEKNAPR